MKKGMKTVVFVPLAHGYRHGTLSKDAMLRCDTAIAEAQKYIQDPQTNIVFGFGAGGTKEKTQARYMEEYVLQVDTTLTTVANHDEVSVFGTLEELQWVVEKVQGMYEAPHFIIVSQARHLRRARIICSWFFRKDISFEFVDSGHVREIQLRHELRAYVRLILVKIKLLMP